MIEKSTLLSTQFPPLPRLQGAPPAVYQWGYREYCWPWAFPGDRKSCWEYLAFLLVLGVCLGSLLSEFCPGHWKHMWIEIDGVPRPVGISKVVWSQSEVPSSITSQNSSKKGKRGSGAAQILPPAMWLWKSHLILMNLVDRRGKYCHLLHETMGRLNASTHARDF